MDEAEILAAAAAIAREAGAIVRQGFGRRHTVTMKGVVNPVTETDLASEKLILERLQNAFPEHEVLSEEGRTETAWSTAEWIWIVDPLDGTVNFAHGFPQVSISMGLLSYGRPVVGVIYDPLHDELFAARRGAGATCNGLPMQVSETPTLAQSLLATGFPYDCWTAEDNNADHVRCFLRRCQGLRRAGSAALDLAYVAAGRCDGYWEMRVHPWDIAAGILMVQEAGGAIQDYAGGEAMLATGTVVTSNGLIQAEMLRVVQERDQAPLPF
jgi:myo-inositol-1(or 4)-monophosphatase